MWFNLLTNKVLSYLKGMAEAIRTFTKRFIFRGKGKARVEMQPVQTQTQEETRWSSPQEHKRWGLLKWLAPNPFPNMPKFQPCPSCHKGSKRVVKTPDGANYRCRRCKELFHVIGRSQ